MTVGKSNLIENLTISRAGLLPLFLDYNFNQKRKDHGLKDKTHGSTDQVDIIANLAWLVLCSRISIESTTPSIEVIATSVKEAAKQLSERCRFSEREVEMARQQLAALIFEEGPLVPLYKNSQITDIIVSSFKRIQFVQGGKVSETPLCFRSEAEYKYFLHKRIPPIEQWEKGCYEGVLEDAWGTRVTATKRNNEIELVLRVPRMHGGQMTDLLRNKTLPPSMALWLSELVSM